MKIYLAGPMRGIPEFNFPAFDAGSAELRTAGYEVFSPADKDRETMRVTGKPIEALTIRECMLVDTEWICTQAEGIALLPGWEASSGANAEVALAKAIGIPSKPIDEWLPVRAGTAQN